MRSPVTRTFLTTVWVAAFAGAFAVCAFLPRAAATDTPTSLATRLADFRRPADIPVPADNPLTPKKVALGKLLFFDPLMSGSGTISCATCHNPGLSWGDGLPRAVGEARAPLPWRSPTVLGMAWADAFGWDGKFPDLESVAFTPITGVANMGRSEAELLRDIAAIPGYRRAFDDAMPGAGVTRRSIELALGAYQRTLVPSESPFDRWVAGDDNAVSVAAKQGFDLFTGRAGCAQCHSGWRFTDDSFHDIGTASGDHLGRGRLFPTSPALRYAFKTPTLRNVAHRAPYMHDGSIKTLPDVIALYDRGGIERPERDRLIRPLALGIEEKARLIAFLETLTGDPVEVAMPVLPR